MNLVPQEKKRHDDDDDEGGGEGDDDGRAPQAGSFMLADADSEPFDGKTIRLDPIIREQVVLALPVSVLCAEDCKGLCTVCGARTSTQQSAAASENWWTFASRS